MAFNIDTLEIGIVTQAAEAVQTIRTLANSLQKLANIQLDSTKIQTFVRELSSLASQSVGLQMLTGELTALSKALNKFKVPKAAANDLRTNIANSNDPEDSLWGIKSAGASSLEKNFDKLIPQLERLNEVGKNSPGLTAISTALGNISAAGSQLGTVAANVRSLVAAISGTTKVSSQLQRESEKLDRSLGKAKKTIEDSDSAAKKASKGFSGFGSTIARVAKMMLIRMAIRAIIKGMREGIQMFVEWDRTSYNSMAGAAHAMDALKTSVNTLKGAFGAFAGQLLTAVQPALTWIIDRLIDMFNLLQQGIALLRGTDKWFKYVGGSANDAAGGVKALKNALFGFDELNVLPSASGGGAGSGVGAGDYKPTEFASWLDPIRKMFEQNPDMSFIEKLAHLLAGAAKKFFEWGGEHIVKPVIKWIKEKVIEPIKTFFKETLPGWIRSFREWFDGKWSSFKLSITEGVNTIKEKLHDLWNKVPEKWRNPIEQAYNTVNAKFFTPLKIVIEAVIKSFQLLMDFVTHPMKYWNANGISTLTDNLKTIWNTAMVDMAIAWQKTEKSVDTGLEGLGKDAKTGLDVLREEINQNPLMVKFNARIDSKGFSLNVSNVFNDMQKQLNKTPLYFPTYVSSSETGYNYNRHFTPLNDPNALGFAGGGVPDTGTLFYAGEAGAEVVANMGHSTGVMNVSQMQEAVANGNIEVVNAVYAMANMIAGAVQNKNFDVYMDSAKVGQSVTKWQYNQQRRGVPQGAY